MHLHILQGVNVDQSKFESEIDNTYIGLKVIEGYDNEGDLAIVAKCDKDGEPQIVSEAHLSLENQTAYATVRAESIVQSFDMRDPKTLEIDLGIKTAPELAIRAMDIALGIAEFSQYYKVLEETQTRR